VTVGLTLQFRGAETNQAFFKGYGCYVSVRADLAAFFAPDAGGKELRFGQSSRWADNRAIQPEQTHETADANRKRTLRRKSNKRPPGDK
jgi:hypothetical protein